MRQMILYAIAYLTAHKKDNKLFCCNTHIEEKNPGIRKFLKGNRKINHQNPKQSEIKPKKFTKFSQLCANVSLQLNNERTLCSGTG